ncbi:MAG: DUF6515 family protein [Bacteroidales bacterium]
MKEILNLALASLAAFSMLTIPYDNADAQVRRTTTTTQNRTTSGGSSTQSRSTSTQNRSTSTQSRSTSSQSRSTSQTRSSSTQSRSTSSQTRQSGSTSQTRQNTSGTTVRRSSGTSSSTQSGTRSSSGQVRQSGSSSQVRQSGTSSQVRQNGSSTQNRQSGSSSSVRRSSGSTATSGSSSSVRQNSNGGAVRQNNSSSSSRETFTARVDGVDNSVRNNPSSQSSSVVRRNSNVTRTGLSSVSGNMRQPDNNRGGSRMDNSMDFRIEDHNVHRIPPRDRDFMHYDRPGHFYDHHHPHYFGFRVEVLPPRYKVVRYFGIDYYIYNDVYYRPYRGHYIVCRPPFGVTIARSVVDISFATVNFAYYSNVYRTFGAIDANNRYIDQQNRIIAQNNATIMAQNRAIAMNPNSALSSYEIANRLGLVQSYAYADRNYFYQDGVFYIVNAGGQYQVIVPPAGALVQNLPEDYDIITLGGVQYYRVDDTVYRLTLVSGSPYLEVLGQMYGQLARDYNGY